MSGGDIHVIRSEDDKLWHVTVEGIGPSRSRHETQSAAVQAAEVAAAINHSDLLIHAEYGTIRGRSADGAHRVGSTHADLEQATPPGVLSDLMWP